MWDLTHSVSLPLIFLNHDLSNSQFCFYPMHLSLCLQEGTIAILANSNQKHTPKSYILVIGT